MPPLILALCIFATVTMLIIALTKGSGKSDNLGLKERLASLTTSPELAARELAGGGDKKNAAPKLDLKKFVSQFTGEAYMAKVEKDLAQASIPMRVSEWLALRMALVFAGFALVQLYMGNYAFSLGGAGCMFLIHIPIIKIRKAMRINKFIEQLAEFLVLITNSLRAGQTFLQGVEIASKESPDPIASEFKLLLKETNLGMPVEQSFDHMLQRVPSEDLKIVMSAFSIQRNVGGNLADIMDQVAAMIRQRIQIQGQIKVLTTQGKLSGAIVGLLPIALATMISMINYSYMSKLWTTMPGLVMLGVGIFMQILGCIVIYKICDIEV